MKLCCYTSLFQIHFFIIIIPIQEVSRLSKELRDVRRRLDDAERDATSSKEECIRLTERLNAVEKEVGNLIPYMVVKLHI